MAAPSAAEVSFRRRWYEAHRDRHALDREHHEMSVRAQDGFAASAGEALELLAGLRRTNDLQTFHEGMKVWARKPGTLDFNGHSGQMMLNQLVKSSEDLQQLTGLLVESLTAPATDDEAVAKIDELVEYVEDIRVGAHPAPGHVPFLISYFWGLADHQRWPVIWASGREFIEYLTGESYPSSLGGRYRVFLERVRELTTDHDEFEITAGWWGNSRSVFADEVLLERAAFGSDSDGSSSDERLANAQAMLKIADYWGSQLIGEVSAALGRSLKVGRPKPYWSDDYPRGDLWVDWRTKEASGLGVRVWVNQQGLAVALRPGEVRKGWWDEIIPILEAADYPGCRILGGPSSRIGEDMGLYGAHGAEFVYGRWFDREELAEIGLPKTVVETSTLLRPLFEKLLELAVPGSVVQPFGDDDPLERFVTQFRDEQNYPTPGDDWHRAEQRRLAEMLTPGSIILADMAEIRQIWSGGKYGGTGPMSVLNRTFRDADAEEYDRIIDVFLYLCWGEEGSDAERIDRLLDTEGEHYVKGLGESVIMKLLAVTRPESYLPVFPYSGPHGKRALLQLLELEEPTGSRGEIQVESNRLLYDRLERFFPGDPWGMMCFLYWYRDWDDEPQDEDGGDVIDDLAEELLVDRGFLDEVKALLEDKGQVIFYGPPGTGKTYLARKLAETLASDPIRRALVQFHPSSSYEDFFEGYRPEAEHGGEMTYRLTPGPLALMAARAADAPGRRHVMIIDEINRANLPKVLGELLFLLEYRGESVRTLYRPEDAFELPQNLWFIGTMNTADRSIALIDAALRRRFHFVPFFPNHGPMKGLLDRWLEKNGEPAWVGELVAQVNDELEKELGGPHLQLGPSHFMKRDLDVAAVRRIWKYNIEPFIEDQFFGDPRQIDYFRFDSVYQRYRERSGADEIAEMAAAIEGDTETDTTGADLRGDE